MNLQIMAIQKTHFHMRRMISGIEVVDAIQKAETDTNDKPVKDIVIESIRVETNGVEVPE